MCRCVHFSGGASLCKTRVSPAAIWLFLKCLYFFFHTIGWSVFRHYMLVTRSNQHIYLSLREGGSDFSFHIKPKLTCLSSNAMFEFCNLKLGPDKEKTTKADNRAETCEVCAGCICSLWRDNHALSLNIIGFLPCSFYICNSLLRRYCYMLVRGAFKWNFWKKLRFCPNQVDPPPPPHRTLDTQN